MPRWEWETLDSWLCAERWMCSFLTFCLTSKLYLIIEQMFSPLALFPQASISCAISSKWNFTAFPIWGVCHHHDHPETLGILHEPQLDGVLSPVWCQLKGKMERFYHLWSMMWTESITRISGLRTKEISSVISEPKNQKGRRCTSLSAIQNGTRGPLWRMLNWLQLLVEASRQPNGWPLS